MEEETKRGTLLHWSVHHHRYQHIQCHIGKKKRRNLCKPKATRNATWRWKRSSCNETVRYRTLRAKHVVWFQMRSKIRKNSHATSRRTSRTTTLGATTRTTTETTTSTTVATKDATTNTSTTGSTPTNTTIYISGLWNGKYPFMKDHMILYIRIRNVISLWNHPCRSMIL